MQWIKYCSWALIVFFTALTLVSYIVPDKIELEEVAPFYIALILAIYIFGIYRINKAKVIAPLKSFSNFMIIGLSLIVIAIIPNIFYEGFEHDLHMDNFRIIYFAHFTFFIAVSYMTVAFAKLTAVEKQGVYREVVKLMQESKV